MNMVFLFLGFSGCALMVGAMSKLLGYMSHNERKIVAGLLRAHEVRATGGLR